jgi:hypothetical protein
MFWIRRQTVLHILSIKSHSQAFSSGPSGLNRGGYAFGRFQSHRSGVEECSGDVERPLWGPSLIRSASPPRVRPLIHMREFAAEREYVRVQTAGSS